MFRFFKTGNILSAAPTVDGLHRLQNITSRELSGAPWRRSKPKACDDVRGAKPRGTRGAARTKVGRRAAPANWSDANSRPVGWERGERRVSRHPFKFVVVVHRRRCPFMWHERGAARPPNVLLCRAGHGNDRKHGALSPASARTKC